MLKSRLLDVLVLLYHLSSDLMWWFLAVAVACVLLGIFIRKLRRFAASMAENFTLAFGLQLWFWCAALIVAKYSLWLVLVGILLLGIGVIPVALFASLTTRRWDDVEVVLVAGVILIVARTLANLYSDRVKL